MPLFSSLWPLSSSLYPCSFPACGHKTIVRPPELVVPETVNNLTLEVQSTGVALRWGRAGKKRRWREVGRSGRLCYLAGNTRRAGKGSDFTQVASVPVDDRERFRKTKSFSYTDEQLTVGSLYRYRVLAFTLDGYQGEPSNTVEIVWQGQPTSKKTAP